MYSSLSRKTDVCKGASFLYTGIKAVTEGLVLDNDLVPLLLVGKKSIFILTLSSFLEPGATPTAFTLS